ncbi:hypothetical protein GCM10007116_00650 [Sulfodiicoccus acidiphilus]|uniref:Methyltransferase type 11 domain-containing protein n=2 Tax=Sulfodiicoccus acidiphilus TaxID=1670455 RepID=A0A830GX72_9CREN|nr:hypothetical protein GCM10007116_00650 [Sulfodiicoccus acidiphilus]
MELNSKLRCPQGHQYTINNGFVDFLEGQTKEGFLERIARIYEGLWAPLGFALSSRRSYEWMARKSIFSSGRIVLDVATGTGKSFDYVNCELCIGLDVSARLLAEAKKRRPHLQLIRADAMRIPLSDGSIDGVIFNLAFHLIPNKTKALEEVERVLKKGGRLTMTTLVSDTTLGKALGTLFHAEPLRTSELHELAKTVGLKVEHSEINGAWLTIQAIKDNR